MQSGKVLRFFAVWDDRGGLYGDRRPYVVHYYLEDDTVEINEVRVQCNVQRWAAHCLSRRSRCTAWCSVSLRPRLAGAPQGPLLYDAGGGLG